jgi:hypothetical protein
VTTAALAKGAFCVSIDLELAWGVWDKLDTAFVELCRAAERPIVDRLLALLARHGVPATWAIVGQLLVERRPTAFSGPAEIWYAPDVVEAIRGCRCAQEVGSHSFAHISFPAATRGQAEDDLGEARRTHARHGLPFDAFVFPRNDIAHVDLLAAHGVRVYRGTDAGWHNAVARAGRGLGRAAHLADAILPTPVPTVLPVPGTGIVELPSSCLLMARNGLRRLALPAVAARKARLGLARAAARREVFHLWFHPTNFYHETETQLAVVDGIFAEAARLRSQGDLDIVPMGAFSGAAPAPSAPEAAPS